MNQIDAQIIFDGDLVSSAKVNRGFNVRPLWQMVEGLPPEQMIIWVDRFDSLCPIASEWALAQALENAAGITPDKRSLFLRTVLCELNRLIWLTTYLGRMIKSLGQNSISEQVYALRESVFQMQEEVTGGRILPQALNMGGCRRSLALGDIQKLKHFIEDFKIRWNNWFGLIDGDPLFIERLTGLLPISIEVIRQFGWWGIVGKASGYKYDSRKHRPHGAYPYLNFELVARAQAQGDALSRFMVVVEEVELSLRLIVDALKIIPEDLHSKTKEQNFNPGFYFGTAESAKGPVIGFIEVANSGRVCTVRLFSAGQRVWSKIDGLFRGIRTDDFEPAFYSLGLDAEDSEV